MARRRVASHFDAADVEGLAVLDLVGQALALLRAAVDLDAGEVLGELVVAAGVVVVCTVSASASRSQQRSQATSVQRTDASAERRTMVRRDDLLADLDALLLSRGDDLLSWPSVSVSERQERVGQAQRTHDHTGRRRPPPIRRSG